MTVVVVIHQLKSEIRGGLFTSPKFRFVGRPLGLGLYGGLSCAVRDYPISGDLQHTEALGTDRESVFEDFETQFDRQLREEGELGQRRQRLLGWRKSGHVLTVRTCFVHCVADGKRSKSLYQEA
jgi:hypothetical protein